MTDCAICLQLLRTPVKVLNCGHSFCVRCLRQLRRQTFGAADRFGIVITLTCPTCRGETILADGRVSSLPTNYALNELLEAERNTNGNANAPAEQIEDDLVSSLYVNVNNEMHEPPIDNATNRGLITRILGYGARLIGHSVPVPSNVQTQTSDGIATPVSLPSLVSLSSSSSTSAVRTPSTPSSSSVRGPASTPSPVSSTSSLSLPVTDSSSVSREDTNRSFDEGDNDRIFWVCSNVDCGYLNYINREFCQRCLLLRFHNHTTTETSSESEMSDSEISARDFYETDDIFDSTNNALDFSDESIHESSCSTTTTASSTDENSTSY